MLCEWRAFHGVSGIERDWNHSIAHGFHKTIRRYHRGCIYEVLRRGVLRLGVRNVLASPPSLVLFAAQFHCCWAFERALLQSIIPFRIWSLDLAT